MTTIAEYLQARCPHTFSALQHLVRAMTQVAKCQGKKSLFGRDKGHEAYEDFQRRLRDTILALLLDGVIEDNAKPDYVRQTLCDVIFQFGQAFPKWEEAYAFAGDYFAAAPEEAEERIQTLMGTNELAIGFASPEPGYIAARINGSSHR